MVRCQLQKELYVCYQMQAHSHAKAQRRKEKKSRCRVQGVRYKTKKIGFWILDTGLRKRIRVVFLLFILSALAPGAPSCRVVVLTKSEATIEGGSLREEKIKMIEFLFPVSNFKFPVSYTGWSEATH